MRIPSVPRPSRTVVIEIALSAVLLLLAGAAASSTAPVCGACHAMRPFVEAQAKSAHRQVSCYDCHVPDGSWGMPSQKAAEWFGMYPAALVGKAVSGPSRSIPRQRCIACHGDILKRVVEKRGLRIDHAKCTADVTCDACHSATAHGASVRWVRQPDMRTCIACHRSEGAPVACDTCHQGKRQSERLAKGPWAVTHGPEWRKTHGMGDLRYCDACHPKDYCVTCHSTQLPHPQSFYIQHGQQARARNAKCTRCHEQSLCDGCHIVPMPHPATFLAGHDKIAKSFKDPVCMKCHVQQDCDRCHQEHTHPGKTDGWLGRESMPAPRRVGR